MKVKFFNKITFLYGGHILRDNGKYAQSVIFYKPDSMCKSTLYIDGERVMAQAEETHIVLKEGQHIRLQMAGGTLQGTLVSVLLNQWYLKGEYEGKWATFQSGCCHWAEWSDQLAPDTPIQTTWSEEPIPCALYELARLCKDPKQFVQYTLKYLKETN